MPSNYILITNHNISRLGSDTASRKSQISIFTDPTQFVYEIIQNADDSGATKITFELLGNSIVIEHNGEPFSTSDVEGITYFGRGVESDDLIKTGRYGIGFKSVFAITATPIILSKNEHFKIYDLYRLKEFPYPDGDDTDRLVNEMLDCEKENITRIVLPFNHLSEKPDYVEELMSVQKAYDSIRKCIQNLNTSSLLFSDSIEKINWYIYDKSTIYTQKVKRNGKIIHIDINEKHIPNLKYIPPIYSGSILREKNNDILSLKNKHYLRFNKTVHMKSADNQEIRNSKISIAFEMEKLNNSYKIIPIDEGQVFIYFPARKENSGLRFHLQAPFVSNAARDSIKDCFENDQLRDCLTLLVVESLHSIRNKGLLTVDFLEVLPNNEDRIPNFYMPIQEKIITEFKDKTLLPMKHGGYSSASEAYKNSKNTKDISDLITDNDLRILLDKKLGNHPLWIKNPNRNSRSDRFISMLDIEDWTIDQLFEILHSNSERVNTWLSEKPQEWHNEFYEYLTHLLSKIPLTRKENVAKYIVETRKLFQTNVSIDNDPSPSLDKSRLIWQTMLFLNKHKKEIGNAERLSRQSTIESLYSTAVKKLISFKWIPQNQPMNKDLEEVVQNSFAPNFQQTFWNDGFKTLNRIKTYNSGIKFVIPEDASVDFLPDGFPYEASQEWLKEINFGCKYKETEKENERIAKIIKEESEELETNPEEFIEDIVKIMKFLKENNITIEELFSIIKKEIK